MLAASLYRRFCIIQNQGGGTFAGMDRAVPADQAATGGGCKMEEETGEEAKKKKKRREKNRW